MKRITPPSPPPPAIEQGKPQLVRAELGAQHWTYMPAAAGQKHPDTSFSFFVVVVFQSAFSSSPILDSTTWRLQLPGAVYRASQIKLSFRMFQQDISIH